MVKRSQKRMMKRGGGWFNTKKIVDSSVCDPNKLVQLKNPDEMYSTYQTCCPKSTFGYKNSAPYCKQLELNYTSALRARNNSYDMDEQGNSNYYAVKNGANIQTSSPSQTKNGWFNWSGSKKGGSKKVGAGTRKRNKNHKKRTSKRY